MIWTNSTPTKNPCAPIRCSIDLSKFPNLRNIMFGLIFESHITGDRTSAADFHWSPMFIQRRQRFSNADTTPVMCTSVIRCKHWHREGLPTRMLSNILFRHLSLMYIRDRCLSRMLENAFKNIDKNQNPSPNPHSRSKSPSNTLSLPQIHCPIPYRLLLTAYWLPCPARLISSPSLSLLCHLWSAACLLFCLRSTLSLSLFSLP